MEATATSMLTRGEEGRADKEKSHYVKVDP